VSAAAATLYKFTVVESVTTTCPGAAPSAARASESPTVVGKSIQPSHASTSAPPHSSRTIDASRSIVARGTRPSELPSR
jgi:hypothetical protein